jgi:hypothetical protein
MEGGMRELKWALIVVGLVLLVGRLRGNFAADPFCSNAAAVQTACMSQYPKCVIKCTYNMGEGCGHSDYRTGSTPCDCPQGQFCNMGMCQDSTGVDMALAVGEPTCTPPGLVSCSSGAFYASPTMSGCFEGDPPPNSIANPTGVDCSTNNIVQCNPGCSFCLDKTAAIPVGCHICGTNNC